MQSGIGVYRGGKSGGYARVHVCHHELTDILNVCLALDDHEWNDQLRDGSFASWTDAAIAGAQYALKVAGQNSGEWIVHRIVGLTVDTNPRLSPSQQPEVFGMFWESNQVQRRMKTYADLRQPVSQTEIVQSPIFEFATFGRRITNRWPFEPE